MKRGPYTGKVVGLASKLGVTRQQIYTYGYDRLMSMRPEALAYVVGVMKKGKA